MCVCVTPESSTKRRMSFVPRDAAGPLKAPTDDGITTTVIEVNAAAVAVSGRPESMAGEFVPSAITYVVW